MACTAGDSVTGDDWAPGPEYDYTKSTAENYRDTGEPDRPFEGRFGPERATRDYTYHTRYCESRERLQDVILSRRSRHVHVHAPTPSPLPSTCGPSHPLPITRRTHATRTFTHLRLKYYMTIILASPVTHTIMHSHTDCVCLFPSFGELSLTSSQRSCSHSLYRMTPSLRLQLIHVYSLDGIQCHYRDSG